MTNEGTMKGLRRNEDAMKNRSWYNKKTGVCVKS